MSSQYPILDGRPINQWKVVELKEELRRRKLTIKGVKEDLVKRLAEAIQIERELEQEEESDSGTEPEPNPQDKHDAGTAEAFTEGSKKAVAYEQEKTDFDGTPLNTKDATLDANEETGDKSDDATVDAEMEGTPKGTAGVVVTMEHSATETHNLITQLDLGGSDSRYTEQDKDKDLKSPADDTPKYDGFDEDLKAPAGDSAKLNEIDEDSKLPAEDSSKLNELDEDLKPFAEDTLNYTEQDKDKDLKSPADDTPKYDGFDADLKVPAEDTSKLNEIDEDSKLPAEDSSKLNELDEDLKPLAEDTLNYTEQDKDSKAPSDDVKLETQEQSNQVSEVSQDLECPEKCKSGPKDSVPINAKDEQKDSLNADNVNLELEAKLETMHPPSVNDHPVSRDPCTLDEDQELDEKPVPSEDVDDVKNAIDSDISNKNDIMDGDYLEKLNLDRSSGEDSMDEDVSESKQVESNDNSDKPEERIEDSKVQVAIVENLVDVSGFPSMEEDAIADEKVESSAPTEKRKLEGGQGSAGTNQPKRQRRWNSENVKVPELQPSHVSPLTTPKSVFQPSTKRLLTRSDSAVSGDAAKERIVPPSQKTATNSLRIDRFLRPFTLNAVKELLGKTGTVCNFWMDQIKTHCYVTYSSVEEAIETRNAVYNLQWPPNGERLLVADFVDPQEVKVRVEAPQPLPSPVAPSPSTPKAPQAQTPQTHQDAPRQHLSPPSCTPLPPKVKDLPGPLPLAKKQEPPILTLDDLFRKTKTTPRIYYLPLSEEEVAAKLAAENQRS